LRTTLPTPRTVAIEYAKIFRKFGSEVTMLVRNSAMSALERIGLDITVAERLLQGLADDG
jgi:pyruvate/2-oxoglutarate dehydrogenase complex dihydrolipoamide dehydrogenase (E3) component